jgi:hypothetical protein
LLCCINAKTNAISFSMDDFNIIYYFLLSRALSLVVIERSTTYLSTTNRCPFIDILSL